jgi:hypothetical protein
MRNKLLTLMFMVGCSHIPPKDRFIHEEVRPYVESFKAEATARKVRINLKGLHLDMADESYFRNHLRNAVGVCTPLYKLVMLRRTFWNRSDSTDREILVYHELGHCVLGLNHWQGGPDLMNPQMMDPIIYNEYRELLLDRLFSRVE